MGDIECPQFFLIVKIYLNLIIFICPERMIEDIVEEEAVHPRRQERDLLQEDDTAGTINMVLFKF